MGVLACDRKDCENIMCDTCVDGIGYICNDCKYQFETVYPTFNMGTVFESSWDGIRTSEYFKPYTREWKFY